MSLTVAIQMDPIEAVDINGDSTFALGIEAEKRGHKLFHYDVKDLSFQDGKVTAHARGMTLRRELGNHFSLGIETKIDLEKDVDVILMRQDPPFHMGYITATHILEHIHPKTLVVNNPASVRNAPEKIFLTRFPDLMPPTLITSNARDVDSFRKEHKDIIVKPLYGNGGAGVFRIREDDQNLNSLVEMFQEFYPEPFIVQKYLSDVVKGDKRIILVDGEAVGAINRVPLAGEIRSNMHVGGEAKKTGLTDREIEICEAIGPTLREQGLLFVGIDVIGDYLTEINVTSPTGIQEIKRFDGTDIAAMVWDAIEKRR
ncbi:glutathione synthase [Paremcibacter congregatus]|uniref:Glutathione synthetase n=1 Tax=Paremcibacter congregatus TaxID=2043170 RepID=A0A2G4YSR8_9PROT|nr:glutathione synthase [Paremcibacter congregatus]PHZ85300.1 glutathione synthase [Paremcibacter congregatus]QDE27768.1 glutathione synthase [Paremcibacter congregatus]